VLIGAGSTVFTPGLLADLAESPVLNDATVALVDIDESAVETMTALGRRISAERGASLRIEGHTDRREALPGATFVTTTIAVGGADAWRLDLEMPERHGISQTVGDSVGPGGVLRALRHIPVLVDIARDIEELAPSAWLINYTNPLTANVRAIQRETSVSTIGLCHGTMHTRAAIARDLGVDGAGVSMVFAGVNHLCWLLEVSQGGRDLYPALRESVHEAVRVGVNRAGEGLHQPVAAELLRLYGYYPAPGDRHTAEFFSWFLAAADAGALPHSLREGYSMTLEYIGEKADTWDKLTAQAAGTAPLDAELLASTREGERVVKIAAALASGDPLHEMAVNLANGSLIGNMPPEAVVEVPAVIGSHGVRGVPIGDLPEGIADVCRRRSSQQELTVAAALACDRALAVQALAADPLVPSPEIAALILDDALRLHAESLPPGWFTS
jgi:alpha-galactosidase